MVSCGCGSCGCSRVSLEVHSPAQFLLIVQTTPLRHSDFSFSSFSILLYFGIPSVLSYVLFCSPSCLSFYSFLFFFLLPVLFSPSVYSLYFLVSLIVFLSNLLSFLFFFLFLLLYSVCFSLIFYYYSICSLSVRALYSI